VDRELVAMGLQCFLVHSTSFPEVPKGTLAGYVFDVFGDVPDNIKRKVHGEAIIISRSLTCGGHFAAEPKAKDLCRGENTLMAV
jgi:hypothetical protein